MDEILIIFHGWGADESCYRKLIKAAPKYWKVFVLHYKNFTKSGKFDDFEDRVLEFLDQHNFKEINLLGHSLGGALAIKFVHTHPHRVKRLFLVDSVGIYSVDTFLQLFINAFTSNRAFFLKHPLQLLKLITKILLRPVYHKRQIDFGNNSNFQKEASEIRIPTIIFWGEQDRLLPFWKGQKLHELIPNSKFILLKGLNHDWILDHPELFWDNV